MKKTSLFLCLMMAHFLLFGQKLPDNTQLKWGKELKFNKKMTLSEVAAKDETGFYLIKRKMLQEIRGSQKLPHLEKYDQNLNLVKSVDLSKIALPGKPKFEQLVFWNNQLWLFYSTDPGKDEEEGLYRVAIDPNSLRQAGESQFVLSSGNKSATPALTNRGFGLKITRSIFHFFPADDQEKLLIVHEHAGTKKNQKMINLLVVDLQFNPLWKKDENIQAQSDDLKLVNAILDSNGNAHLLSKDGLAKTKAVFSREKSFFTLTSITDNGGKALHKKMNLGKYQINEANIQANAEGHLYFGGFFTEEAKAHKSTGGTYFVKMDGNSQSFLHQEMEEFEEAFLTSGLSNAKAKKTSKKLSKGKTVEDSFFYLDKIIIKDDGSVAFVGEDRVEKFTSGNRMVGPNNGMNGGQNKYEYTYGSIVVAEFDPDGKRKWARKVVKNQKSVNDAGFFFSYSVSMINNNLYFIFNDNVKNIAYKGQGKVEGFNPRSPKEHMMAFVKLDNEGTISRSSLSMYNNRNLLTITPVNTQTDYHEMVVYGQHKKKYRLARLAFDPNRLAAE